MNQPWQNRIVGHEDVDPLTLRAHAKNIRTHASAQRRLLESALDELGHVGKIVVSQRTRRVLNGHLRVELAIGRDEPTIPVTWIDVDEAEELVVLAFFDQIGEQAEIDATKLQHTFSQVTGGSDGLQTMLADWVASFNVTIVPAKPTVIAPPLTPIAVPVVSAPERARPVEAPAAAAPVTAEVAPVAGGFPAGEALVTVPVEASAPAPGERAATESTIAAPVIGAASIAAAPLPTAAALPPLPEAQPEAPTDPVVAPIAVVVEVVEQKKAKAEKPAPPPPTTAVIKIGEYDQEIDLATFNPWWNALVESCVGDGFTLMTELKNRLGIVA